jgi:hypothetical protein
MVDYLVGKCPKVEELWQREGGSGTYPPPSIRALLFIYLLDAVPTDIKHTIVVYFFIDLASVQPSEP